MSPSFKFTKENLDLYLNELAKELKLLKCTRKLEIIIVGGASILLNYNFRPSSYDVDAYFVSDVLKQAINNVADKLNLPVGWLNKDFIRTPSFSPKIIQYSSFYKEFKNVLTVRTISSEYLVAMKLVSFRNYKDDITDIANIISEDKTINLEKIKTAVVNLYGFYDYLDKERQKFIEKLFN